MSALQGSYDEVEIEDMTWNEEQQVYQYSCPCGDLFEISLVCCLEAVGERIEIRGTKGTHSTRREGG